VTWSGGRRPRVTAHRGASSRFPENTVAAFGAAIDAGVDAIEFDVHATIDGELVVIHDFDLARTTNGTGLVHEQTWDYVRSLDAGSWRSPEFSDERVPLVADVLALAVPALELEVKGLPSMTLVDAVCHAVERSGRSASVEITGHDHLLVREIKQRQPGVSAGYFAPRREVWMSERLYRQMVERSATYGGFDVVHVSLADLRSLDVDRLHRAGLLVHAAHVNRSDELLEAMGRGADDLTTNDPVAALALFRDAEPAGEPTNGTRRAGHGLPSATSLGENEVGSRAVYVVVSGPPGSGKTTLAGAIAKGLSLPLLSKDTIKEPLMDTLLAPDIAASRQLGRAAMAALYALAAAQPYGSVLESNFQRSLALEELSRLPGRVVEIFCRCDRDVAAARYRSRAPARHRGHFDAACADAEVWSDQTDEPIAGGWPVLEVRTADGVVNLRSVLFDLRRALGNAGSGP
jgi:glycerophosphoryl diester phosphodiesterase